MNMDYLMIFSSFQNQQQLHALLVMIHTTHTNIHQLRLADTQLGDGTPVTFEKYGTGSQCMECHRSRRNAAEYASDLGQCKFTLRCSPWSSSRYVNRCKRT